MYVFPISNNNQIKFGEVVRMGKKKEYSACQNQVAADIEHLMKTPSHFFNEKSPEEYYENKGFDFGIIPAYDNKRVNLIGYKFVKKRIPEYSEPEEVKSKSKFVVGTFDNESKKFNLLSLLNKIGLENQKVTNNIVVSIFHTILAFLAIMAWMPIILMLSKRNLPTEQVKPQIEKVNKTVASDSLKEANKFIEVIKKEK